jgi:hypothetical protein
MQNTLPSATLGHAEHHLQRLTTQNTQNTPATQNHAEHIAACNV